MKYKLPSKIRFWSNTFRMNRKIYVFCHGIYPDATQALVVGEDDGWVAIITSQMPSRPHLLLGVYSSAKDARNAVERWFDSGAWSR